jgi:hypothetical protein
MRINRDSVTEHNLPEKNIINTHISMIIVDIVIVVS